MGDIDGFKQLFLGSYKSDKPNNTTGIDKVNLKCGCINGSIVNGIREPILYCFALSSPPGHKIYNQHRIKIFLKINESIISHIIFYLEGDNDKPIDFHRKTVTFTCQISKI